VVIAGLAGCSGGNPNSTDLRSIAYGETKDGAIDGNDGVDPEYGDMAEPVSFEGRAGDDVAITMTSTSIDSYLMLVGPEGTVLAENDDDGDSFDSRIETRLTSTGTHTIWAGSWDGNETGAYTLTLDLVTGAVEVYIVREEYQRDEAVRFTNFRDEGTDFQPLCASRPQRSFAGTLYTADVLDGDGNTIARLGVLDLEGNGTIDRSLTYRLRDARPTDCDEPLDIAMFFPVAN
jgi:hypothetical protein